MCARKYFFDFLIGADAMIISSMSLLFSFTALCIFPYALTILYLKLNILFCGHSNRVCFLLALDSFFSIINICLVKLVNLKSIYFSPNHMGVGRHAWNVKSYHCNEIRKKDRQSRFILFIFRLCSFVFKSNDFWNNMTVDEIKAKVSTIYLLNCFGYCKNCWYRNSKYSEF